MAMLLLTFLFMTAQVTQGRVKRSDDTNPLMAVVDGISARVNSLEARLASQDNHVSFMAEFSQESLKVNTSVGLILFDYVVFNEGNAYNSSQGIFTVPTTGVYIFSTQLFLHATEHSVCGIYYRTSIDGKMGVRVASKMGIDNSGAAHYAQSVSTTAVVKLNQGDQVWVQRYNRAVDFYGQYHSFFTGALLHAY